MNEKRNHLRVYSQVIPFFVRLRDLYVSQLCMLIKHKRVFDIGI